MLLFRFIHTPHRPHSSYLSPPLTDLTYLTFLTILALLLPLRSWATFGVTSLSGSYTVDTGAGLVFKVNQSSGDITSIQSNGVEYQATDKNSHLISGLGTATVTATTFGDSYIKISITTSPTNSVVSS